MVLALMDILSDNWTRFVLIVALVVLFFHFYRASENRNAMVIGLVAFLFLGSMMNPYIIAGIVFAMVYTFFAILPYLYRERTQKHLRFQSSLKQERKRTPWIGNLHHMEKDVIQFDDIVINRVCGRDTIHLDNVILHQHENVIVIRKLLGDTVLVIPVDVAVKLHVSSFYGDVRFPQEPLLKVRNESLMLTSSDYGKANRSVKIILSGCFGNVEVIRR